MKIRCEKSELQKSTGIAMHAVPARATMTILECILITADENGILFTTNDAELGIETKVNGEVLEKGTVAVHARMLSEIVRRLPDLPVTIETDDALQVHITCGKSVFNIAGRSDEEFIYLPALEREGSISVSQYSLRKIIQQTIFSVANGDNNRIMNGELFEINKDMLRLVSLDGHRISIRKLRLKEEGEDRKVIVDGRTLNEVCRIFTGNIDDPVEISFTRSYIIFEMEGTTVISRLIDGEYFAVDNMISTDYETKVVINRQEFLLCIDRATLFVREGDKKPIILDFKDKELTLSIESQIGSLKEDIEIDKEGRDVMIGFNPRFLIDVLKVIEEDTVTLYFMTSRSACIIRDEENSYIYLMLPVNFAR